MIIFINGSINSGKSTVAKLLHKKIKNSALLEIDSLYECIEEYVPIDKAIDLNLKNAVDVIKNFIDFGLDVIVPYPLSKDNFEFFKKELAGLDEIKVFTLNPRLEEVLKNRGGRELDDQERERIKYHYQIGINSPNFGVIIDNTEQTVEETVRVVWKFLL